MASNSPVTDPIHSMTENVASEHGHTKTRPYEDVFHCDESLSPSDCIGGQDGGEPALSAFLGHASDLFLDDQVHLRQLTSPVGAGSAEKCHSRTPVPHYAFGLPD
jgi:hypothetical protein